MSKFKEEDQDERDIRIYLEVSERLKNKFWNNTGLRMRLFDNEAEEFMQEVSKNFGNLKKSTVDRFLNKD